MCAIHKGGGGGGGGGSGHPLGPRAAEKYMAILSSFGGDSIFNATCERNGEYIFLYLHINGIYMLLSFWGGWGRSIPNHARHVHITKVT